MMGVCLRYARDRDEACAILNKGFLKVFNSIDRFQESAGRIDSWIYKIILNTAIDHLRQEIRYRQPITRMENIVEPDVPADVVASMSAQEIIGYIQQLPPAYRTVFNLYVIDGHSHPEIAKKLNISIGTSKSNLAKARKKLQRKIIDAEIVKLPDYVASPVG